MWLDNSLVTNISLQCVGNAGARGHSFSAPQACSNIAPHCPTPWYRIPSNPHSRLVGTGQQITSTQPPPCYHSTQGRGEEQMKRGTGHARVTIAHRGGVNCRRRGCTVRLVVGMGRRMGHMGRRDDTHGVRKQGTHYPLLQTHPRPVRSPFSTSLGSLPSV